MSKQYVFKKTLDIRDLSEMRELSNDEMEAVSGGFLPQLIATVGATVFEQVTGVGFLEPVLDPIGSYFASRETTSIKDFIGL